MLQIHWHPTLPGGSRSSNRLVITIHRTDTVTTAVEINTIRATRIIATTGTNKKNSVSLLQKRVYNKNLTIEPAPATAVSAQASLHFVKIKLYMCSPGLTHLTGRDGHGWMGACRQGEVTNCLSRARTPTAMGIIGEPWRSFRTRPAAPCRSSDQQRPGQFRRNGCPMSTEAMRSCVEQTARLASGEGVIERTSQSECWPEGRLNSRDTAGSESPQ